MMAPVGFRPKRVQNPVPKRTYRGNTGLVAYSSFGRLIVIRPRALILLLTTPRPAGATIVRFYISPATMTIDWQVPI